jgi:hypothetical protein
MKVDGFRPSSGIHSDSRPFQIEKNQKEVFQQKLPLSDSLAGTHECACDDLREDDRVVVKLTI